MVVYEVSGVILRGQLEGISVVQNNEIHLSCMGLVNYWLRIKATPKSNPKIKQSNIMT